jgi:hypothetical protein
MHVKNMVTSGLTGRFPDVLGGFMIRKTLGIGSGGRIQMRETICWYPNLFVTLVPAPVAFDRHEKESTSSEVAVQCMLSAMASQNSAHEKRV